MSSSTSSGCYVLHNDEIEQWSQSPCADPSNGVQACCQYGDVCVGSSICRSTTVTIGTSSYYTGGCTDETFSAAACLSLCGSFDASDIVLDSSTDLWACCYGDNGRRNCSIPSLDKTFQAPFPQDLTGTFRAPREGQAANYPSTSGISSTILASTTTASGTPSPSTGLAATSSTPPGADQGTPSGLSGGQKAGIGVGGAIAWFALMVLLFWFWWRRRRTRENTSSAMEKPGEGILAAPGEMDAVKS